jgi:putative tryptophan/tyrosine transport system substrate-binding protein
MMWQFDPGLAIGRGWDWPNVGAIGLLALSLSSCGPGTISGGADTQQAQAKIPSIAVTQIVEHPSLNAVRDGLQAGLAEAGFDAGKTLNWQWQSAQGNPATAVQIAKNFAGDAPTAIVAISTPSAQAAATAIASATQTALVFAAVTDPVAAKLVPSWEKPGGQITGVSDRAPVEKHLALIQQILPQAKRIGTIYNAGESNSLASVAELKIKAKAQNLSIVEVTIANSSDVSTAAKSLVGQVDVIYIPTDNTVASALESALKVGVDNKLPIFSGDNDSVKRGAIGSVSFNYFEMGKQTARLTARILKGESPATIPVEVPAKTELALNLKAAAAMGVTIPEAIVQSAIVVTR